MCATSLARKQSEYMKINKNNEKVRCDTGLFLCNRFLIAHKRCGIVNNVLVEYLFEGILNSFLFH